MEAVALPWVPVPGHDENLAGWIRRIAVGFDVGSAWIYRRFGLPGHERREIVPAGLGLDLSAEQVDVIAATTQAPIDVVAGTTLRRYEPLLDFRSLVADVPATVRRFSLSNPVEALGFRACGECIRSDLASRGEIVWRNLWRLQTSAVCVEHEEMMHRECPVCGFLFLAAAQTQRSLRSDPEPFAHICGAGPTKHRCDFDLRDLESTPAPMWLVAAQRSLNDAVDANCPLPASERAETIELLRYVWGIVVASGAGMSVSTDGFDVSDVSEAVLVRGVKRTRLPSMNSTLAVLETFGTVRFILQASEHPDFAPVVQWLEAASTSLTARRSYAGSQELRDAVVPARLVDVHQAATGTRYNTVHRLRRLPDMADHQIPFVVPKADAERFFADLGRVAELTVRRAVPILLAATGARSSYAETASRVGLSGDDARKYAAVLTEQTDPESLEAAVSAYQSFLIESSYDRDHLRSCLLRVGAPAPVPEALLMRCCELAGRRFRGEPFRMWAARWLWERAGLGWWQTSPFGNGNFMKAERVAFNRFDDSLTPETARELFAWAVSQ